MKKLLSGLLTIVMFVTLFVSMILFGVRTMLSENSVGKMLDVMNEEYGIIDDIVGTDEELEELFEDKKAKDLMSEVVSGYVKYTAGITDEKPDIEKFIDYVVEETDVEIDEDEIDNMIDDFEADLEEAREESDSEEFAIIRTLFSPTLITGSLVIVAVCAFGIYALSKDAKKTVKRIGIVAVINGLIVAGFGSSISSFIEQEATAGDEVVVSVVEVMLNTFKTTGIASLVIGVVLIVIAAKVLKKNTNIAASNQAIQNLDNSVLK